MLSSLEWSCFGPGDVYRGSMSRLGCTEFPHPEILDMVDRGGGLQRLETTSYWWYISFAMDQTTKSSWSGGLDVVLPRSRDW